MDVLQIIQTVGFPIAVAILPLTSLNYLCDLQLTKSLDNSLTSLTGKISTNTLLLGLNNLSSTFSTTSPLYSKIRKGEKLVLKDGAVVKGTFYITDYDAPEEEPKATIKAVDRLYYILNQTVEGLEIEREKDVKAFIKDLLVSQGISEEKVLVDETIAGTLNYGVATGQKVSEVLNEFALATDTYIYMDAGENVVVKSRKINGVVEETLTHDADLYELTTAKSFKQSYNTLILGYGRTSISAVQELLKLEEEVVDSEEVRVLNNNKLDKPLYDIDQVKLSEHFDLIDLSCSQNAVSLSIENTSEEDLPCSITVYGRTLEIVDSYVERKDEGITDRNELKVNSKLIQDKSTADNIAAVLYNRLNLEIPNMRVGIMPDDFSIELCKIIRVLTDKIDFLGYIHSFDYTISEGDVDLKIGLKAIEDEEEEVE
mgnify:CR=1 FL=1